jgi:hypothetical protein
VWTVIGIWVNLIKVPKPQLYAGNLIFVTGVACGTRQSAFDSFLHYVIVVPAWQCGALTLRQHRYLWA